MVNKKIEYILECIKSELDTNLEQINNSSFDMGLPGISLFYYYYYLMTKDEKYLEKTFNLIEKSINNLSAITISDFQKKYLSDSLDNHLSGFGRFLIFLDNNLSIQLEIVELLNELDTILKPLLYSKLELADYDIDSGALASGYYFLSRYKQTQSPKYKKYLIDIILSLKQNSKKTDYGIYWTSPSLNNKIYLGLSHGSSMIVNFLVKMIENNIYSFNTIQILINNAISFVCSNERDQIRGKFPHCYFEDEPEEMEETQFSQCYGDLGIGYSILKAGYVLRDEKLRGIGEKILKDCLIRKKSDNLTEDASIVYGASGVACLYDELYTITSDPIYKKASNYWYCSISSYTIKSPEGHDSFKSMFSLPNDLSWHSSFGWGLAGIGATLIRYLNKKEYPSFNELLMIGS